MNSLTRRDAGKLLAATLLASPVLTSPLFAQPAVPTGVRFSFMLWALAKQVSFDRALEIVSAAGYQGVELTGQFQTWTPEERTRILARMKSLNLVVDSLSGLRAGFAVPADSDAFLTQFTEHVRYATELHCPQIILLSGKRVEGVTLEAQRQCSIDNLKRAAEIAARSSIEIVIEPIDYLENPAIFMASVTQAFDIAQAVNIPTVKVLYDLYHEQRSFGNLLEKLEKNIDRIGLIHIADVPGRHEPGTGEIAYAAIYRKLAELKYSRWIAMEYYPTTEPIASLKKARLEAQSLLTS
jgi:hydroxypyruvate isomerase